MSIHLKPLHKKTAAPNGADGKQEGSQDASGTAPVSQGPADAGGPESDQAHLTRTAGVVGGATLLSRILGAVRDIVIASVFGTGMISDAFIAAFRIPNLLRRLFGEGSLSIAFIPIYTETIYHHGREEGDRMAGSAIRLMAIVLALITIIGMAIAPLLVHAFAPGFSASAVKFALTVRLTRTMFPYVFFIGMVALCMGILNVLGHFAAPALAPAFLNVGMITAVGIGSMLSAPQSALVMWLAVGVSVGGALQLSLQLPFLMRHGIHFHRHAPLWHPAFARIAWMMGPVLFGTAVYQINNLAVTLLASLLPQGSISYLYYADRLVQFPLGIFGVAMATAVLPTLSRQSAAQQYGAMRQTFAQALSLVLFITLPAMSGLIVLREPIVSLLFQRGAFNGHSMRLTASALLYYCMGLWAFAAIRIVLNVFYALKDTRTPVRAAVMTIVVNLALGVILMGPMQHNGLALALSLASMLNLALLTMALRRKLGALGWRHIAVSAGKSALCAAVMGACVRTLSLRLLPPGAGKSIALLPGVATCALAGALVFILMARLMGLAELKILMDGLRNKKKV
jgi:putative peptidoglycan lipid II flippase